MTTDKSKKAWSGIFGFKTVQPVFQAGPVAGSPEEAQLIGVSISNFTSDGPRQTYSDWLSKRGETDKANRVLASLEAYETGHAQALGDVSLDDSWSRLMGLPLLRVLIEQTADREMFDYLKVLIFPWLKPALSLDYRPMESEPPVGSSYLWGQPDLEEGVDWALVSELPTEFGGFEAQHQTHPCAFIGQIAWRDFKETVFGQDVPEAGGLSIFAFTETLELGIMEAVIRPWSPESRLSRRAVPQALVDDIHGDGANELHAPHRLRLTEVLSLPDAHDGPFQALFPDCGWNEKYGEIYEALVEACGESCLGFGGYLRGTSGGDPSPDTHWRRVAVMRTTPDCGVLHFALPQTDIKTGRLDDVRYVWMDWDS